MAHAKSVVVPVVALALALIASWVHADSHTCLIIERPWSGSIGLWVNRCDVGVDVTWNGEGGCESQRGNKYPCSSYVAPNAKAGATLEGRVEWVECKSPGGLGDVIAMERPDGRTYCWGDPSPRERADLVRRRERESQKIQRLRVQIENERNAQAQRRPARQQQRPEPAAAPQADREYWGAFIQYSRPTDLADLAWGVSWNARTPKEALDNAIKACRKRARDCHADQTGLSAEFSSQFFFFSTSVHQTYGPERDPSYVIPAAQGRVAGYPPAWLYKQRCVAVYDDNANPSRPDFRALVGNTEYQAQHGRLYTAGVNLARATLLAVHCNEK